MITAEKAKVLDFFKQGRKLYVMRRFEEAKVMFENALQIDPKDGPSSKYVDRCDHYIASPPPDDWDGVWVMTEK